MILDAGPAAGESRCKLVRHVTAPFIRFARCPLRPQKPATNGRRRAPAPQALRRMDRLSQPGKSAITTTRRMKGEQHERAGIRDCLSGQTLAPVSLLFPRRVTARHLGTLPSPGDRRVEALRRQP